MPPPFEVVLRGFDRQQVIDHLNALDARVATMEAERDSALGQVADLNEKLAQLRQEAAEAAFEVDRLQRSPLTAATARMQRMLQMAEDEAAELRTTAEQETTALRESARAEADRLLAETRQRCERLEAESTDRRQTAEAQSATHCQRAQQQSERDIARREAETDAWVREYQTRAIAALHLIMQMTLERLTSRVAKAKRQVTAAKTLRSEVSGQLSEVHRLLAEALGVVDQPAPAEQAEFMNGSSPAAVEVG